MRTMQMMKLVNYTIRIALMGLLGLITHQAVSQQNGLRFVGRVVDEDSNEPVPYATVAVYDSATTQVLAGNTTGEQGQFSVATESTNVYIEISFMGYETAVLRDFPAARNGRIDLGTVSLARNAQTLDEVQVTRERSTVEFRLDKRVFNVGNDISSTGMGALDVLDNVPSVSVNVEGEVRLRGNAGVQILINGKPSVLTDEGSNALSSITADMIDRVEVITNPSAKYEAEGTSGIINIVLKKEEKKGFNGSVSANTGIPDNHSLGASLNRRTERFNLFTQFGGGYRSLPTFSESRNLDVRDSSALESEGTAYRNEAFVNITLGSDFYINPNNVITLSGSFAFEDEDQPSETEYLLTGTNDQQDRRWRREEVTTATNPKWQYDLQYQREFTDHEDHVLLMSAIGRFFGKEQESEFSHTYFQGDPVNTDQQTATEFYQADYTFKLDYTDPLRPGLTLETGAQYDWKDVGNDFAVFNRVGGEWVPDSALINRFEYDLRVAGMYATMAYENDTWGVKTGLRVEHTLLQTLLVTTGEANKQNFANLFPSLHGSYKFTSVFSAQVGYSRRVFRPRLWDLNPFFNIRDNFNIRQGNPDLQPEFGDSYELTALWNLPKASFSGSVYQLYTTDVIERVSFFDDNVNVTMPVNVGTNRKTGFELTAKYDPARWVSLNGDANYGFFRRNGRFGEQDFAFRGDQWSARIMSKFKLPAQIDMEFSPNYQSGFVTVQGRVSGFAFLNLGVRKKLWNGKGIINLGVRDVFASRIRENRINRPNFELYTFSQRGRFVTLGLSYGFGKGEAMMYSGRRR